MEVLGARAVPASDSRYVHLRSPRILHVETSDVPVAVLEFQARDRGALPRDRLGDAEPSGQLGVAALAELSDWLGRRYHRAAFPDAFVNRLSRVRRRLERLFRRFANDIDGIYVALDRWDECAEGEAYRVILRVVVDGERWLADTGLAARLDREFYDPLLRALADAEGIVITSHTMLPDHHVRLADLKHMEALDLDFLSYELGQAR